jgi:hypothetical protein
VVVDDGLCPFPHGRVLARQQAELVACVGAEPQVDDVVEHQQSVGPS